MGIGGQSYLHHHLAFSIYSLERMRPLFYFSLLTVGLFLSACGTMEPPPTPDTTAPQLTLSVTPETITGSGAVTLRAVASDNVGVSKVSFYRGTTLMGEDTTAPYEVVDQIVTTQASGKLSYRAVAVDAAGNATEKTVDVVTLPTVRILPPLVLRTTLGGAAPITNTTMLKASSTITLKDAPEGVTLQKGNPLYFGIDDVVATLYVATSVPMGSYTFSAEITTDGVTTRTPITLKLSGWRSYALPQETTPAKIVSDQQGNAYVVSSDCRRIERIDRSSGAVTTYNAPAGQCFVGLAVTADGQLWTWDVLQDHLVQLDPTSGQLTPWTETALGGQPYVLADGAIWWFNRANLNRFDPTTKNRRTYAVDTSTSSGPPSFSLPNLSSDGTIWFKDIDSRLARLNLSTGTVEFLPRPREVSLHSYALTNEGLWITYTNVDTSKPFAAQFDPATQILSKTVDLPRKYGYVGGNNILTDRDNTVLVAGIGEGAASMTRINTVDGSHFNYWLTTTPTNVYSYTFGAQGSVWIADLDHNTVNLFIP